MNHLTCVHCGPTCIQNRVTKNWVGMAEPNGAAFRCTNHSFSPPFLWLVRFCWAPFLFGPVMIGSASEKSTGEADQLEESVAMCSKPRINGHLPWLTQLLLNHHFLILFAHVLTDLDKHFRNDVLLRFDGSSGFSMDSKYVNNSCLVAPVAFCEALSWRHGPTFQKRALGKDKSESTSFVATLHLWLLDGSFASFWGILNPWLHICVAVQWSDCEAKAIGGQSERGDEVREKMKREFAEPRPCHVQPPLPWQKETTGLVV